MIHLIGAGGHGLVVSEIFTLHGTNFRLLDSNPGKIGLDGIRARRGI